MNLDQMKLLVKAVYQHGEQSSGRELAQELFGDGPDAWASFKQLATDCKRFDYLKVSLDFKGILLTPKGRQLIGVD